MASNLNKYKKEHLSTDISRHLTDIICHELDEEVFKLASINEIQLNKDFSVCKVYVSHLDSSKIDTLLLVLAKRKNHIRKLLSQRLTTYSVPAIVFIKDELLNNATKIDSLLNEIKDKKIKTLDDLQKESKKKK